uniref:Sushi domain-containing protein n=1 Tax=Dicentrarchus labrax TaxID=13489 RepID=A0A8P4GCI1_DICLA
MWLLASLLSSLSSSSLVISASIVVAVHLCLCLFPSLFTIHSLTPLRSEPDPPPPTKHVTAKYYVSRAGRVTSKIPPPLTDGDIRASLKSQYNHNERVEYMCQNYYTMDGQPHKTCVNGEWIGQMRCLRPCTVNEELIKAHNIIFRFVDIRKLYIPHNDQLEFMCVRGRRHDRATGNSMSTNYYFSQHKEKRFRKL